jgi:hypothetical protein
MPTATRGNAGEAAVLEALVSRDFEVLVPFGCLVFNPRATDHGRGPQSYRGLADIFGVYFPPVRSVYLLPLDAVAQSKGRLRLVSTQNNQRCGIRFATDFEIDRWSRAGLEELVPDRHPESAVVLSPG